MRFPFALILLVAGCDAIPLIDRTATPDVPTLPGITSPGKWAPTCSNDMLSPGETDVDCGGPACGGCGDGRACLLDRDCASASCAANVCISCNDAAQNGSESDVDCGGDCTGCALGQSCNRNSDCLSNDCTRGVCSQPLQLSFAMPIDTPMLAGVNVVAVGDFDGDERVDVVASNAGQTLSLFFGNGKGGLPERLDIAGNNNHATTLVTADFNHDSRDDIVFGGSTGAQVLSVLTGSGNHQFGPLVELQWPTMPDGITVGDFNGDKKLDVATSTPFGDGVMLGIGDGAGNFVASPGWRGSGGSFAASGDFNADGLSDVALGDVGGTVDILLGTKNKGLQLSGTFMPQIGVTTFGPVAAGDFDNDGHIDVIATAWYYPASWILHGNGAGALKETGTLMVDPNAVSALTADFDFDGNLDLAVACDSTRTVDVFRGDGKGNFAGKITLGPFAGVVSSLALGDFNGDKKTDIVIAQEQGVITMILNTSN